MEPGGGGGGGARNREVGWAARAHVRLASKCVCDLTVCASRGATSSLRFAGPPPLRSVCECGFPAHACSLR